MTETLSCPSCFKVRRITAPSPVCAGCIKLVPTRTQSALASAILAGDELAKRRALADMVKAASDELDRRHAAKAAR